MKRMSRRKRQQAIMADPIVRYQTDVELGLSEEQIEERIQHKLVNDTKIKTSNSYFQIFLKNICTVFNLIWLIIAIALMCVGAWSDLMFLFVVIANTAISIFQEIRAKNTVEKLSMVTTPTIHVIRTGLEMEIKSEDLLLDDVIILENGNQIPADCKILEGEVEANESLLTGESNSIKKHVGDTLLAGSFLVSGKCIARVDRVGKYNYIQTVAERAKDFKPQTSNLFKDLNALIKVILIILVPVGVLTFFKEMFILGNNVTESIKSTSGALTGMIPAGMYLLVTVSLSIGVLKLAKKKTLVKNLYSIEMLARADVLCLDKTGTLTDGTMKVVKVFPLGDVKEEKIDKIMKTVLPAQKTSNATSVALIEHFGTVANDDVKSVQEFSSSRKYSATTLQNGKTYYIGAVSFIKCQVSTKERKLMNEQMEQGFRIISLVEDSTPYNEKNAGKKGKLIAFFALEDHVRKDAKETISWFKENNVALKVISGDDALTVSKLASRVGIENSDKFISLENMSLQEVAAIADKFTVFGRVTPEQKHTIIKTLKTQGHTVAMTGDGVNDTLALKEANCSIAMADGSEVARNISHLVLLESNFSALPSIVKEGRQVVNNVQNSSVLYLMKTLFTIMLCITTIILQMSYPFSPSQLLLMEMFVIGIPSFILTLQPNNDIIRGNFIPQVLKKSIPCALLLFVNVLIVVILKHKTGNEILTDSEFTSLSTMVFTFVGFINLVWSCWPLNWLRSCCCAISLVMIVGCIAGLGGFFKITDFTFPVLATLLTFLLCTVLVVVAIYYISQAIQRRYVFADGRAGSPSIYQVFLSFFRRKEDRVVVKIGEEGNYVPKPKKDRIWSKGFRKVKKILQEQEEKEFAEDSVESKFPENYIQLSMEDAMEEEMLENDNLKSKKRKKKRAESKLDEVAVKESENSTQEEKDGKTTSRTTKKTTSKTSKESEPQSEEEKNSKQKASKNSTSNKDASTEKKPEATNKKSDSSNSRKKASSSKKG